MEYTRCASRVNRTAGTVSRMADIPDGKGSGRPGRQGPGGGRDTSDDGRDLERRRKRAVFLSELDEARALRERVQPRRARAARMRQQMRMRTFRW